jgi:hypothetical protein
LKLVGTQGTAGATRSVAGGSGCGRHFDGLAGPTEQSARVLASPHGILGRPARSTGDGRNARQLRCSWLQTVDSCPYTKYARSCSWLRRSNCQRNTCRSLSALYWAKSAARPSPATRWERHKPTCSDDHSPMLSHPNACLTFDLTFNWGLEHVPSGPRTACSGLQIDETGESLPKQHVCRY